jgi:DNA-binding transcriptional LysR family regulator
MIQVFLAATESGTTHLALISPAAGSAHGPRKNTIPSGATYSLRGKATRVHPKSLVAWAVAHSPTATAHSQRPRGSLLAAGTINGTRLKQSRLAIKVRLPETDMYDLNDHFYYTAVVSNGGFAAASRALGIPRSQLSRRVQRLEDELGTRLIERSTRTFRVTDLGNLFYERCRSLLDDAESARSLVVDFQSAPKGLVRLGCPLALVDLSVSTFLPEFLELYPEISVEIVGQDTKSDLVNDAIDLEIRTGLPASETQTTLTMRKLGRSKTVLVAGGAMIERVAQIRSPADLISMPSVSMGRSGRKHAWQLHDTGGNEEAVSIQPRLVCRSLSATLGAVRSGLGIGLLLESSCRAGLESGELARVLPGWQGLESQFYLVFTTSRGLSARVRVLVDFLVEKTRNL